MADHRPMRGSALGGLALLGLTAGAACELFHDTDWKTRCDAAPASSGCPATTSSSSGGGAASGGGGGSSSGGAGAAGGDGGGAAGGNGSGGSSATPCEGVPAGVEYAGRCYVDITMQSASWAAARAACQSAGTQLGKQGDLVVLDDVGELDFLTTTFLDATSPTQDAWIGYVCDTTIHAPGECYCGSGGCATQAELDGKRAAWSWIDGLDGGLVDWAGTNPNGDGLCAAVSAQPTWLFVDRDCEAESFVLNNVLRTYRTVCELR